jgi:hypothetical protein
MVVDLPIAIQVQPEDELVHLDIVEWDVHLLAGRLDFFLGNNPVLVAIHLHPEHACEGR